MPRKKKEHNQAVSQANSTAQLHPLNEYVCPQSTYRNVFAAYRKWMTPEQYWFVVHLYECTPLSREDDGGVPIPANVIKKFIPKLYPTGLLELVEKGHVVAGDFSKENHECRHYFLGETFLADLEREDARNLMREKIVRAADGKIACSLKHRYTDDNGKRISPLNCAAMNTLKTNVINMGRLEQGIWNLDDAAKREPHYRKRKRLELKSWKIWNNLKYVLRQWHMPVYVLGRELLKYQVAYKGSTTGRMYEYGGAIQTLPKAFKARAYDDVFVTNYDVRSCHIAIIGQLCREEGVILPWTEEYVKNKQAKHEHATCANIPVDIWKACLIGLYYGAVFGNNPHTRIHKTIWEYLEEHEDDYTPDHITNYYDRFVQYATPYLLEREQWFRLIETTFTKKYTVRSNGEKCLKNACGAIQPLDSFANNREIAMFICQGLESAFINHLMILGKDYGYTPRALEHDGLIVDNPIPEAAVAKARELSGFHVAQLQESTFFYEREVFS